MRSLALPLIAAALLAGCGEDEPTTAAPQTNLVIRVDADGARGPKAATTTRLRCPGDGCAATQGLSGADMAPPPANQACTQIYGGPQTATVTGTLNGEPVDASFKRTDGCQITRWQKLKGVLEG
jgi:hypothetical protein